MTTDLVTDDRQLVWDGCLNVRDLGGLPTRDGRRTRRGAVVRADNLDRLTAEGWTALQEYGIRTVLDLRDAADHRPLLPRPDGVELVRVPLDELAGAEWWARYGDLDGTPLSLRPYLEHCRPAVTAVVAAVAGARPGAVAVHCGAGRDRTGLAALVLLAVADVTPAAIVSDYLLSAPNLRPLWAMLSRPDQQLAVDAVLARAGTTAEAALLDALAAFAPDDYLPADDLAAVRQRLRD
ncbi:tyrosine-protein phosphatase [Kitasatospora sp. MAP5-34]|uniref:tyrosine-protein phosphatase n=1 Tax=Kitasatospora sp. MAP5-34 TaxID=3035102 RepID=UPI00247722A5|nr:tyrosine-protein phosphatase [Kitasatospora sp. MAP5-34]MDH6578957.1 protein-tyrosine phosphatase [Kitasatospora sp. MAP5-34]